MITAIIVLGIVSISSQVMIAALIYVLLRIQGKIRPLQETTEAPKPKPQFHYGGMPFEGRPQVKKE